MIRLGFGKKNNNVKKISWAEFEVKAKDIDAKNEIEYKKLILNEKNSLINVAEKYAELKVIRQTCDYCKKILTKEYEASYEEFKAIGSVKNQFERG